MATVSELRLSGNAYVPMRLRDEEQAKTVPIPIVAERNCEHTFTVCKACAWTWELDYVVFYRRTGGGRKLATEKAARGTQFHGSEGTLASLITT